MDSQGRAMEFTTADLDQAVNTFNKDYYRVPLCVGHKHPTSDAEADGWINRVWRDGDDLWAEADINADFEDKVTSGKFKNVSSSFYMPDSPTNPYPGQLSLRHLSFVLIPAVKGLAEFAQVKDHYIEFETMIENGTKLLDTIEANFSEQAETAAAEILLADINEFAENYLGELETNFSEKEQALIDDAVADKIMAEIANFAEKRETTKKAQEETRSAERTKLEAENAELRAKLAAHQKKIKTDSLALFAESLYSEGRLTEANVEKALLIDFMSNLEDESVISFNEGTSMVDTFKAILSNLPQQVSFKELEFDKAEEVAPTSETIHAKALAYAEEHKCDYVTALKKVVG